MKKIIVLILFFSLFSCSEKVVEKPEKLIEKSTMENILYDLALLQAIRTSNPQKFEQHSIDPKKYIYQKYKIDSAQFSENSKYYASDIAEYKKMFETIAERLKNEKKKVSDLIAESKKKKLKIK